MSYLTANMNMLMSAVKKAASSMSRDFSEIEKLQSSVRGHQEFVPPVSYPGFSPYTAPLGGL